MALLLCFSATLQWLSLLVRCLINRSLNYNVPSTTGQTRCYGVGTQIQALFEWRALSPPRPLGVSHLLPTIPTVEIAAVSEVCVFPVNSECGRVFVRGKSESRWKQKFAKCFKTALPWLIMMIGVVLMGAPIDTKQMDLLLMYRTSQSRYRNGIWRKSDKVEVCKRNGDADGSQRFRYEGGALVCALH